MATKHVVGHNFFFLMHLADFFKSRLCIKCVYFVSVMLVVLLLMGWQYSMLIVT